MIHRDLHDILTLLTLSIFADKRVYAKEIDVLVKAATEIPLINNSREVVSEAKVLSWYEMQKDYIRSQMSLPRAEFEAWIIPLLKRIEHASDKDKLTHLMEMIAIADGEVHVSERALINLVKRNWGGVV